MPAIVRTVPGSARDARGGAGRALGSRPPRSALTGGARGRELVCASLAADLTRGPRRAARGDRDDSPDDSLEWARQKVQ